MAKPRVRVPKKPVKTGEAFQIKALIPHKMESGQRKDKKTGETIPRMIINKFVCTYNGEEVFSVNFEPAISANPYLSFHTVATESGTLEFTWTDDEGKVYQKTATIKVE
ncbi:MAG: sulfur oxidation protein [Candidatus Entotheonella gemina]|uniref:Sulfur oxidation protein n=1 Tax=Candidatus Entotheonella gemina TaxID=1429439 RepID=W4M4C9_9BACT|nr:MAG: sulfur oxidation protein [Candidatus Entotheonella gemina]